MFDFSMYMKNLFYYKKRFFNIQLFSSPYLPELFLQKLAPFQVHLKVAGLHRVCPSTTLDKSIETLLYFLKE
jgi:hypothetical protein